METLVNSNRRGGRNDWRFRTTHRRISTGKYYSGFIVARICLHYCFINPVYVSFPSTDNTSPTINAARRTPAKANPGLAGPLQGPHHTVLAADRAYNMSPARLRRRQALRTHAGKRHPTTLLCSHSRSHPYRLQLH